MTKMPVGQTEITLAHKPHYMLYRQNSAADLSQQPNLHWTNFFKFTAFSYTYSVQSSHFDTSYRKTMLEKPACQSIHNFAFFLYHKSALWNPL